ncbi:hypothetical protein GW835_01000 [archaeon]|nr:hypothetical protein [archaeon]NCP79131.1 hypothetical protein [archaeon]NCP97923.1 hypothetical protein [archaeon]NCQ06898.1 hypothetical protein [archaeon]NCQ50694.1 hypothetical protein [archaeon]
MIKKHKSFLHKDIWHRFWNENKNNLLYYCSTLIFFILINILIKSSNLSEIKKTIYFSISLIVIFIVIIKTIISFIKNLLRGLYLLDSKNRFFLIEIYISLLLIPIIGLFVKIILNLSDFSLFSLILELLIYILIAIIILNFIKYYTITHYLKRKVNKFRSFKRQPSNLSSRFNKNSKFNHSRKRNFKKR